MKKITRFAIIYFTFLAFIFGLILYTFIFDAKISSSHDPNAFELLTLYLFAFFPAIVTFKILSKKRRLQSIESMKINEEKRLNEAKRIESFSNELEKMYNEDYNFKREVNQFVLQHGDLSFDIIEELFKFINEKYFNDVPNNETTERFQGLVIFLQKSKITLLEKDLKGKHPILLEDVDIRTKIKYIYKQFGDINSDIQRLESVANVINIPKEKLSMEIENYIIEQEDIVKSKRREELLFGKNNKFTLETVDNMSGYEFEDYLNRYFKSLNITSTTYPYSNDYGADLSIKFKGKNIIIQAKNYSADYKVSISAIQEVKSAAEYYNADSSMVITNSYFTRNAIELARKTNAILVDRDELENLFDYGIMHLHDLV